MKTPTAFALALCLVSSLALADNPSDAPLVTDNEGSVVVQQNEPAGCTQDHRNKKDASLRQQGKQEPFHIPTEKSTAEFRSSRQDKRVVNFVIIPRTDRATGGPTLRSQLSICFRPRFLTECAVAQVRVEAGTFQVRPRVRDPWKYGRMTFFS